MDVVPHSLPLASAWVAEAPYVRHAPGDAEPADGAYQLHELHV